MYTVSRDSVRNQVDFFRLDPENKAAGVRARGLELAEVLYVGGELSRPNIKKFIALFNEGRLVAANNLCSKVEGQKGTQLEFAVEVANFRRTGMCTAEPRAARQYRPAQSATGFWETSPLFASSGITPGEDGSVPVGYGVS